MASDVGLVACRQAPLLGVQTERDVQSVPSIRDDATAAAEACSHYRRKQSFLRAARPIKVLMACASVAVLIPGGSLLASLAEHAPRTIDVPTVPADAGDRAVADARLPERASGALKAAGSEQEAFSIVVWGASLPDFHDTTECRVRAGKLHTLWDEKLPGSGRVSSTSVSATKPVYKLGMIAVGNADDLEIQVRLYTSSRGEEIMYALTKPISALLENGEKRTTYPLSALGLDSSNWSLDLTVARGGTAPHFRLKELGVDECTSCYEALQPVARPRAVSIKDIDALGPMLVGKAPLPENLQGLWWQQKQGTGGALVSFGGPTNDAGSCSTGYLTAAENGKMSYSVRTEGDGVWSSAMFLPLSLNLQWVYDLIYHFEFDDFDDAGNPTSALIYTWGGKLHSYWNLPPPWAAAYKMFYAKDGVADVPGSKVWKRRTTAVNIAIKDEDYNLVQVMDAAGSKLEPAWTQFVTYMNDTSKTGDYPGWMFYKSIHPSPTLGAEKIMAEIVANVRVWAIVQIICLCVALVLLCACCCFCRRKCRRVGGDIDALATKAIQSTVGDVDELSKEASTGWPQLCSCSIL